MKKILTMMLLLIASAPAAIFAGTPINQSELPEAAQEFITKYFPNDQIRKVEKDNDHHGTEYEVEFVSGSEIDFRSDGQWKEVKASRGNAVPSEIVPQAIANYVSANFKGQYIVEISRKRGGYEIEISNGSELKLTEDAQPMQPRHGGKGPRK